MCKRVVGLRINQLHQQFVYFGSAKRCSSNTHTNVHARTRLHMRNILSVVSEINGHKFKLI